MTRLARASMLAAVLVALVCGVCATSPASGAAPFRELTVLYESGVGLGEFRTDGVRFAVTHVGSSRDAPLVFDTFSVRRFRPSPPFPGCEFLSSGGGLLVWSCPGPSRWRPMISELATGIVREPVGWDAVAAMESEVFGCHPYAIGRRWLEFSCGFGLGPTSEVYLNHRTGTVATDFHFTSWFPNLDRRDLGAPICAPLGRTTLDAYAPPFALQSYYSGDTYELRLRRCGSRRFEILRRCPVSDALCESPQLGSRYVTWGEGERVFAYLPRIRRRVLVGRAPAALDGLGELFGVAHTCNRVFAQWSNTLYVARFKPRRGAPPCQSAG